MERRVRKKRIGNWASGVNVLGRYTIYTVVRRGAGVPYRRDHGPAARDRGADHMRADTWLVRSWLHARRRARGGVPHTGAELGSRGRRRRLLRVQ